MAYGHMSDRKALAREIAARTKPRFIETTTVSPNGLGGYNAYTSRRHDVYHAKRPRGL
jgi:hypothetical protein